MLVTGKPSLRGHRLGQELHKKRRQNISLVQEFIESVGSSLRLHEYQSPVLLWVEVLGCQPRRLQEVQQELPLVSLLHPDYLEYDDMVIIDERQLTHNQPSE